MGVDLFNRFITEAEKGQYGTINYIGEIRPEHFSLNEADLDQLVQRFFDQLPDFHTLEEFVSVSGFSESEVIKDMTRA